MANPIHLPLKKDIICAIDFGTSGSGYGLWIGDKPYAQTRWSDGNRGTLNSPKNLTQLLYQDDKLLNWGFAAAKQCASLLQEEETGLRLEKYFKMKLFVKETTTKRKGFDMAVDYLKCLWEDIRTYAADVLNKPQLSASDIKWCLSIPAIWTNQEKQLMKKAAVEVGLIPNENVTEEEFLLILEPEAAAVYCLQEIENDQYNLQDGSTFLVVDAGGGTLDFTAHTRAKGKLEECTVGGGSRHGSSRINKAFLVYLKQLLGNDVMAKFKSDKNYKNDYQELLWNIETFKCGTKSYAESRRLSIPKSLVGLIPEPPANLKRGLKPTLELDSEILKTLFSTVDEIVVEIQKQIDKHAENNKTFQYIFLVGGFAESNILQETVRQHFGNVIEHIVVPRDPIHAVISGGMLLGRKPELIGKLRFTYGLEALVRFDPNVHTEENKMSIDGRDGFWCKNYLDKFVTAGDSCAIDSFVERVYKPQYVNQKTMHLAFYHSPLKTPKYTTDNHVVKTGELIIDMPDTTGGLSRNVNVKLYFGKTEVRIQAEDSNTHKMYKAVIDFSDGISFASEAGLAVVQAPQHHIIFINDSSGSMCAGDVKPSLEWIRNNDPQNIIMKMQVREPNNGTNFLEPMKLLRDVLRETPPGYTPVALFMTDGVCYGDGAKDEFQSVMNEYKDTGFILHTVLISDGGNRDANDVQLNPTQQFMRSFFGVANTKIMEDLAEIGGGKYFASRTNLEEMKNTYKALAALLE